MRDRVVKSLFEAELSCVVESGELAEYPRVDPSLLTEEEQELELQYREQRIHAVGHGAAANWDVGVGREARVNSILAIRPDVVDPAASVFGLSGQFIVRRFSAAAKRAGYRATAHSARVTYASELTRLGASTNEVMRAGAWKTARMVAHYSAGVGAEDNATAKYL